MKTRKGFVSNSSSTAFIIRNKTNESKTLVDFVQENPQLIEEFRKQYDFYKGDDYTQEKLLESAKLEDLEIPELSSEEYIFGDEQGTLIGQVFDYILRDGGESESFEWYFKEYLR